jgi:hypothetical protein
MANSQLPLMPRGMRYLAAVSRLCKVKQSIRRKDLGVCPVPDRSEAARGGKLRTAARAKCPTARSTNTSAECGRKSPKGAGSGAVNQIIRTLDAWRADGQPILLAAVYETIGSTYSKAGHRARP